MKELESVDLGELVESGLLLCINNNYLHPLGLSLKVSSTSGNKSLEILRTDDPEGFAYETDIPKEIQDTIKNVTEQFNSLVTTKHETRKTNVGFVEQPLS